MIKNILLLLCLTLSVFAQQYDDNYPEENNYQESNEFNPREGLPTTDYEEVPRQEEQYAPEISPMPALESEDMYEDEMEFYSE